MAASEDAREREISNGPQVVHSRCGSRRRERRRRRRQLAQATLRVARPYGCAVLALPVVLEELAQVAEELLLVVLQEGVEKKDARACASGTLISSCERSEAKRGEEKRGKARRGGESSGEAGREE